MHAPGWSARPSAFSATAGLVRRSPGAPDEVIERSDYMLISMPAMPDTIGLMDRRRLGLMKSTAENIRRVAHGETPLNLVGS